MVRIMKKLLIPVIVLIALCCTAVCLAESHTHTGGTATCESLAVCSVCGQTYGHLTGHDWGAWVSDNNQTHTRTCKTNSAHTETRYHMGGASTCTTGAKCVQCGATHADPLGHTSTTYAGYAPTCISNGATDGEMCSRCGVTLVARRVIPARGHSFNAWEPLGDGTHFALCTIASCGVTTVVECSPLEITVEGDLVTVCPICGECADLILPILIARPDDALPMGQLLVRGAAAPVEGLLYAFTVTGSYAGKVVEMDQAATITLPEDLSQLPAFRLIRVDVTPATEAAERSEIWTEIVYRLDGGALTFTAEEPGVYLLVTAE